MRTAICKLRSVSPYSQSRMIQSQREPNEDFGDFEQRTWRERCHTTKDGEIFIPANCFKHSLSDAAQYLGRKIKGKGNATYTKRIKAGVLCVEPLGLGVNVQDVDSLTLPVSADGKPGGAKRVMKTFPIIHEWCGEVQYLLLDDIITKDEFAIHLEASGSFIGIGRYRPINNGTYGRFAVESVDIIDS